MCSTSPGSEQLEVELINADVHLASVRKYKLQPVGLFSTKPWRLTHNLKRVQNIVPSESTMTD